MTPERLARTNSQSRGSQPDSAVEAVEVARVPLTEEVVRVSKREVVTGRGRVRTLAESSDKLVRQELDTAQVSVTRSRSTVLWIERRFGRLFAAQGHGVRLMSPEYVRPYVKA